MKAFMDQDFLLGTDTARELYHGHAERLPIIDYHCHLNPGMVAEDYRFRSITELWLGGDHYKWRAMRTNGVDERYITGDASDWEKFEKWAETVPYTLRNPLYHWTHLELRTAFGIDKLLNPSTARDIYEECNAKLAQPEFSARGLMRHYRVETVCTTDDPVDSLEHHIATKASGFEIRMLPTWRPDKAMAVDEVIETRLAEARTALACRDADAVYAWCADLSARLPRCRAFCRHKAVDALCATIIPALRRDGVACDLDIDLDDDCPLSSAELCALFANLLDNAGTACLALPRDRRWMTLRAHVVLGCLVIEASNAAASPPRRSFREDAAAHGCRFGSHGWGLSIIRGIAERHGGTFDVSHVVLSGDGPKFIARVVVPCPAQSVMT